MCPAINCYIVKISTFTSQFQPCHQVCNFSIAFAFNFYKIVILHTFIGQAVKTTSGSPPRRDVSVMIMIL